MRWKLRIGMLHFAFRKRIFGIIWTGSVFSSFQNVLPIKLPTSSLVHVYTWSHQRQTWPDIQAAGKLGRAREWSNDLLDSPAACTCTRLLSCLVTISFSSELLLSTQNWPCLSSLTRYWALVVFVGPISQKHDILIFTLYQMKSRLDKSKLLIAFE